MHIAVVVERYPTEEDPVFTFVRDLVAEICKKDIECSVICPQSITRELIHRVSIRKKVWQDKLDDKHSITVYQPYYISLSNRFARIGNASFNNAAKKVFDRIKDTVDVLYCHFWKMGLTASCFDSNKPLFVASGESEIDISASCRNINKLHKQLKGTIYVSTKNYEESCKKGLQVNEKYIIAPNGVNGNVFYKHDKQICRKQLGIDEGALVGIFVGAFNERKGIKKVEAATSYLDGVKMIYLGSGDYAPGNDNVLFAGNVSHERIPIYLSAADFFVLPTMAEGCCNAIVEALSCGLPVISSNLMFNSDILDESCSILIDPKDIGSIKDAVRLMYDIELRTRLSQGALNKAKNLRLDERASKIIQFVKKNMMLENEDKTC